MGDKETVKKRQKKKLKSKERLYFMFNNIKTVNRVCAQCDINY